MRLLMVFAAFMLTPGAAFAQYYSADSGWDFSAGLIYQGGDSASGSNGSSFKVNDDYGLALTLAYNIDKRFSVGVDLDYLSPRYSGVIVSDTDPVETVSISQNATQYNTRFKGTYKFTDGPFVPYAQLGIGWSFFDSNVADGPPQTGCWWHPWWGYICSGYYRTYNSTEFSYGVGVGARYEITSQTFLNFSYDYWELDTGGDRANPSLETFRVQYGWKF